MKLTENRRFTRGAYENGSFNKSIKEAVDSNLTSLDDLAKDVGHYLFCSYIKLLADNDFSSEDIELTISNPDLPQRLVSKVGKAIIANVDAEGADTWWDTAKSEVKIGTSFDSSSYIKNNTYIPLDDEFDDVSYSSDNLLDSDLLGESSLTKKNHPALQNIFKKNRR